jgi:hypothetical protein
LKGLSNRPRDPDGDNRYEDVNGDGSVNVGDAQALFVRSETAVVDNYTDAFDYNGDGSVNVGDAQTLFGGNVVDDPGGPSARNVTADIERINSRTVRMVATDVGPGTTVTGSFDTLITPSTPRLSSIRVKLTDDGSFNATITQTRDTERPPVSNRTNIEPLAYYNVSHPSVPDDRIEEAKFRIRVPKDRVTNTSQLTLSRFNSSSETWEPVETTLAGQTTQYYVYRATSSDLSLFRMVRRLVINAGPSPTLGEPIAVGSNGSNTSTSYPEAFVYEPYYQKSFNESYWNERALNSANIAAGAIRAELRAQLMVSPRQDSVAVVREALAEKLGAITPIKYLQYGLSLLRLTKAAANYGDAIQNKAVAIHLNDQYSSTAYQRVREELNNLINNTERLERIQNENSPRYKRLQSERLRTIERLHVALTSYLDAVHTSVVRNAAGAEDVTAYEIVRSAVSSLAGQIRTDYHTTSVNRTGSLQPVPLTDRAVMPTHGWTLPRRTVIYDSIDTGGDYAVYRVNARDVERVSVTVGGTKSGDFETLVTADRPRLPTTASGRTVEDPSEFTLAGNQVHYVIVRGGGNGNATGPYEIVASSTGEPVPVSVVKRGGPDVQRPNVNLIERPDPVELQEDVVAYPTNQTDVSLVWEVWDDKSLPEDLEYKYRIDSGQGFPEWSGWTSVPTSGQIDLSQTFDDGVHRVQLAVRDEAGKIAVRNVDVVVSTTQPQTYVESRDDVESNTLFVQVLPDRRIDSVELEYRRTGTSNWTDWQTVNDTQNLGVFEFPRRGEYEVRARAVGLGGTVGAWDRTTITYDTPPTVALEQAPPTRSTDPPGRITNTSETALRWQANDSRTTAGDLEYRVRTDATGAATWSVWQSVSDNGSILVDRTYSPGAHRVEIQVRDQTGNRRTDSVRFDVDQTPPGLRIAASDGVTGGVIAPNATEPVRTVELQYRPVNETEWRSWETLRSANTRNVSLGETGRFEVRARATDFAGNVGSWTSPSSFRSLPEPDVERDLSGSVGGGGAASIGGLGGGGGGASYNAVVNGFIEQITGELLLELYVESRDGTRYRISSITYTDEGSASIPGDLPPNITSDAQLSVEVRGNGTVRLESLRLFGKGLPAPEITVSPRPPTVGSQVSLQASIPGEPAGSIETIEWDVDTDGTYELNGSSVNQTFETAGLRNVTVRATNVFDERGTATVTVDVNSPPVANVSGPEWVLVRGGVRFSASASSDPDGSITEYAWDFDGDGTVDARGENASYAFQDAGNRTIQLRVTDDDGATILTTQTVRVRTSPINTSLSISGDLDAPGNRVTLQYDLTNLEDTTIENVEMDVGDLPVGWSVAGASFEGDTRGEWTATDTRATATLAPFNGQNFLDAECCGGVTADKMHLNLRVKLPANTSTGEYRIPVTVTAGNTTLHQRAAVANVSKP